jgi:FkbM family methyltransferase
MMLFFLRFLRKIGLLKLLRLKTTLRLNDTNFSIPIIQEVGMHNLMMDEFWMLDIIKRLSPNDDDVFMDIGANVGQSLLKWKSVNWNSTVVAIDPNPHCVSYLKTLIADNQLPSVKLINSALSTKNDHTLLNFHFNERTDRSASTKPTSFDPIKSIDIQSIDFDRLLNETQIDPYKIKLIKMDIEGGECDIIKSMGEFLKTHRPLIIIEILSNDKYPDASFYETLGALNYSIYRITKSQNYLKGFEGLTEIESSTRILESDYLLLPSNRLDDYNLA